MEDERKTKKQLIEELNCLRLEQIEQTKVNQEKFTKAFLQNSIPVAITTVKEGRFVDVSNAFLRLVGYKREEVIGHTSRDVGFITEAQRVFLYNELNKKGCIEDLEMELSPKGRGLRYGLFNVVMMSYNNENYLMTAIQDITERKRMNEIVQKSEDKFNKAFHSSPVLTAISTIEDGRFLDVNEIFLSTLLFSREEVVGKTSLELGLFANPVQRQTIRKMTEEKGYVKNIETQMVSRNGQIIDGLFSAEPVTIDDNNCWLTIMVDMTERKRVEAELRKTEAQFSLLFNSGKDYIAVHLMGKDGQPTNFIQVNDAACEKLGYTREEMLKLSPLDVDAANSSGQMPAIIEKLIKNKQILFETEMISKKGHRIPMEVSVVLFQLNGNQANMCVARDITERKKAEEALRKSEEKYRLIIENIMDCVLLVDKDGIIQHVSNSLKVLGYEPEDMIGINGFSITHPDDLPRITRLYHEAIEQVWNSNIYETKLRHKDGHYVTIEMRVQTLSDPQGKLLAGVFLARDITWSQQNEEKLLPPLKPLLAGHHLSPRESEILCWVMQGKSTWDIARIIQVSESTVKFHIDKIMTKLSAVNRTHAVAIAMREELIGIE